MLTVAEVDIPHSLQKRLRREAAFAETFADFTRENLIGFRQPAALAIAVIGPVLFAFVYYTAGFFTLLEVALSFCVSASMFLLGGWYVNRGNIREQYVRQNRARKEAIADLQAATGQSVTLEMRSQPVFYEHEHGVICLADAGEGRTIYFDVDSFNDDPRWFLYINGDMHRVNWSWIKLMGSGAIANFQAEGQRLAKIGDVPFVEALEAWEAISIALGEPQDGDVINLPVKEVERNVARLL